MLVIFQLRSDLGDVLLGCLIMAGRRHFGPPAIVQLVLPEPIPVPRCLVLCRTEPVRGLQQRVHTTLSKGKFLL